MKHSAFAERPEHVGEFDMGKRISQFMWGYQGHFRIAMESKAKRVLSDLAPGLKIDALLVGVQAPDATEEQSQQPAVCMEPEDEEWDPEAFAGCAARTETLFKAHPDHELMFSDELRMRDMPQTIRKKAVYEAVREVLDANDTWHGTKSFCTSAVRVEGYYVVPIFQLNKAQFDEYPCMLAPIEFLDYRSSGGFLDCVIQELLREVHRALWAPEPGRFSDVLEHDSEVTLRRAGDSFCSVLLFAAKDVMFQDTFKRLNSIAALRYEGDAVLGTLLVASDTHPEIDLKLQFAQPVPLEQPRWARKVLEMSKGDLCCVCTGAAGIQGLGTLTQPDTDGVFLVEFTSHFKWQLRHKGRILLQSSYGVPRLPRATIKEPTFKSIFRRVFPSVGDEDEDRLWQIVDTASRQRHGTMIVVTDRAHEESERLKGQSTPVAPILLTTSLVNGVGGIDGAILVDSHGVCHAIGVILDGIATEDGNPARGARFNSAVRYYTAHADVPMLLVVVSEDGDVDMVPPLLPQIARSSIERRIARLGACTIDNYAKPRNWLCEHAFYLDAEQCKVVNEEIVRIESTLQQGNDLLLSTEQFLPHPEMDDSYYLTETEARRSPSIP